MKIEKRRLEVVDKVIKEANKSASILPKKEKQDKHINLLLRKDMTVEKKKAALLNLLHDLTIKTISFKDRKDKKKIIEVLKHNVSLLRNLVMKLRDINHYLETIFLDELGILKSDIKLLGKKELSRIKKEEDLEKKEISKLENTVYELIDKLIFSDRKLISQYKRKAIKEEKEKKLGINEIGPLLRKQSALLAHIESKLPPPDHIRKELITRKNHTHWAATLLALLAALEDTYGRELKVFEKLKKKDRARKKLGYKISHIIKEKERLLKLRDQRIDADRKISDIDKGWIKATNSYVASLKL